MNNIYRTDGNSRILPLRMHSSIFVKPKRPFYKPSDV